MPRPLFKRDLSTPLPLLDEAWIGANFTPADQRSDEQKATLALSDSLMMNSKADTVVIGVPICSPSHDPEGLDRSGRPRWRDLSIPRLGPKVC